MTDPGPPKSDEDKAKDVEFYAASVNAWYATALEHDKSIFNLAAGGIALLITLLTTVGFSSLLEFFFFVAAIVAFSICIGTLLVVFKKNQNYIEHTVGHGGELDNPVLRRLDRAAQAAFFAGVIFASAAGFSAAWTTFSTKASEREKAMATQRPTTPGVPTFDSVNGAARLQIDQRSFNGSSALKPASAPAQAPATTATPAPTASAPASAPATSATKPASAA